MPPTERNTRDNRGFDGARLGLSILGALQEQQRNSRPNVPFNFQVSSPKFSFSASRRPAETDILKVTLDQLESIDKQREKVFKEQEALDAALGQSPIGKALLEAGLQPEVQLGEDIKAAFAKPKLDLLSMLFAGGAGAAGAEAASTSEQVGPGTPGATQLPSGKFGIKGTPGPDGGLVFEGAGGIKNLDAVGAIKRIQNLAPDKASDTEKKDLANLVNSISSMDSLLNTINSNRSGFEKQLGPMNLENFPGGVGQFLRRVKGDPVLNSLAVEVETTFQQVRSAITGAQASARELELLRPLTPELRDPLPIFIAKTLSFRKASERILGNKLNVLEAAGTEVSDLRKFMEDSLSITEAEYKIQLIENGVSPEQAESLSRTFAKEARQDLSDSDLGGSSSSLSEDELANVVTF